MISKNRNSFKWVYLPVVVSSAAILSSHLNAGEYQAQGAQQVQSIGHQYVGGKTRLGVSVTDDGDASVDINQVFSETQNSSTSGGLWAGFDLDGDDKGIDEGGVQINHNWVSRNAQGIATHVNKAFGAYDRNSNDDAKVTIGYGQERQSGFWEGHVSKGVSDKRLVQEATDTTAAVYEKAFDYGVGGSIGKHLTGANARVRAGLDYQWADEVADNEDRAVMTTVSAGIEKYFQGTPHSVGLDVAASRSEGGYDGDSDTDTTASLSYNYDFGGANIYQPDQRYRRVRVEIPGKGRAATYAKKPVYTKKPIYKTQPVYENKPIYKKEPVYVNKTVRVPTGNLAKSSVALEGQTFFKYNSAVLIPSAQQRLRQIIAEIRKHGYKGNIRITGNSCGLSDTTRDRVLSEQRASAVRNFMIAQGFNPSHLVARGLGSSHPKYSTENEDFRNRRVDIEYVTERTQKGGAGAGYRNETKRVQNGFRNVIAGYKRVQTGTKNVQVGVRNVQTGTTDILVTAGAPGTPRVIWRTEPIATTPAWITRALRSNFDHNRNVDTYRTTAGSSNSTVVAGNSAPIATDDAVTVSSGKSAYISVLSNDSDPDGTAISISSFGQGQYGSVAQEGNQLVYTANGDFEGTDSFTYTIVDADGSTAEATVYVTVTGTGTANTAPTAVNDSASTTEDQSVLIDVKGNDSDVEGEVTVTSVTQGNSGSVTIEGGQVRYTPSAGFTGTDSFSYTITDADGLTATAQVSVVVTAAASANTAPKAEDDTATTTVGKSVMINVLGNDFDYDAGDLAMIKSFQESTSKGGVITSNNNQLVYTPAAGFVGTDSFTYTIEDMEGLTATATVTVVVNGDGSTCTATCTVANMDDEITSVNTPVTIDVLHNDTGTGINVVEVSQGQNGTVKISGNKVVYTPSTNFVGNDYFWYKITDASGYSTSNKVMVYVVDDSKK